MVYETLLLDFDHTLFDTDASEAAAFDEALRRAGVAAPAAHLEAFRRINRAMWSDVERGRITPSDLRTTRFERLAAAAALDVDPVAVAEDYARGLGERGDLYPGADEVLERLASSCRLALVTNAMGDVQRRRIERLGVARRFEVIVISTEVGAVKPDARIFDITFDRLRRPPRRGALMVGDGLGSDMRGGAGYGLATCWFNPRRLTPDSRADITHEVHGLAELPALAAGGRVVGA